MEDTTQASSSESSKKAVSTKDKENDQQKRLSLRLRGLMACLLGLFITGVGMVAIGQPTPAHKISSAGNTFWHTLFVFHMVFLAGLTISALIVFVAALSHLPNLRVRAVVGLVAIACGSISGSLSFQGIHPALTLFLVGMFFLVIAAIYGPLLGQFYRRKDKG